MQSLISIVIPCYNARRWIADTIRSALQPCRHRVEVIVIDDGSTDGSGDLIDAAFPELRLVRTPNQGVSHARNLGIQLATGDLFVFLDADDLLTAEILDRQVSLLEKSGSDVVYGNWQRLRSEPSGEFVLAEKVVRHLVRSPEIEFFTTFWCPTGAYLFRRSIVARVGGFSPRLPVIQDARFALDCALHGARFTHDPEIACLYRVHAEGSVSTRSRAAFFQDQLTNIIEIRAWWESHGGLTPQWRGILLEALDGVAQSSCGVDPQSFAEACRQVQAIRAGGRLPGRSRTRLLAAVLGYERALTVEATLRHKGIAYLGRKRYELLQRVYRGFVRPAQQAN